MTDKIEFTPLREILFKHQNEKMLSVMQVDNICVAMVEYAQSQTESLQKKVEELEATCESERAKINRLKEVGQQQHEIIQQLEERNKALTEGLKQIYHQQVAACTIEESFEKCISIAKQLIKQQQNENMPKDR
jgi:hypothetical protein